MGPGMPIILHGRDARCRFCDHHPALFEGFIAMATPIGERLQPLPDHYRAPWLHAGFWMRVAAYIIDGLILTPVFVVLYVVTLIPVIARGDARTGGTFPLGMLVSFWAMSLIVPWFYYALCESSNWQATPGKLALGLRVTDLCGRPIGFGRATGRFFGKLVSGLIMDIGYMLAGWTARKQALHDLMAECCVVRRDGLVALARGEFDEHPAAVRARGSSVPGWAVALIVLGIGVFMLLPIFAAIAIPAYQVYLVRSQVAEGLAFAQRAQPRVAGYIVSRLTLPVDNVALGFKAPDSLHTRYVSSLAVDQGRIIVTFGEHADGAIRGRHLVTAPEGNVTMLRWRCSSPDIEDAYLPESCR
jgi:uncharacterized RDD family membrane protein YckC/Tfp pilus assembly major pilin PilA